MGFKTMIRNRFYEFFAKFAFCQHNFIRFFLTDFGVAFPVYSCSPNHGYCEIEKNLLIYFNNICKKHNLVLG